MERMDGLDGYSTAHGHTFDGGSFHGGGPHSPQSLIVRMLSTYGRPASVELDLCDDRGGRSVSLTPERARQVAAWLNAEADKAQAKMDHWRGIIEESRAKLEVAWLKDAAARAGETVADDPDHR